MVDTQQSDSKTEAARQAASEVKDQAAAQGGELKSAASEHAGALAGQVKEQTRNVLGEARQELERQADTQGRRLGEAMGDASRQLRTMADAGDGPVSELTRQLADSIRRVSDTVDRGGVQAVAEDLRSFARRQPGLFLVGAGVAGFVATRLLRANASSSTTRPSNADGMPAEASGSIGGTAGLDPAGLGTAGLATAGLETAGYERVHTLEGPARPDGAEGLAS